MKRKINNLTQPESKLRKYIVEAPEPRNGQKLSSGGIRENGKMSYQFRNPVPYDEVSLAHDQYLNEVNFQKTRHRSHQKEIVLYLLNIVWEEYGENVLRSCLNKLETSRACEEKSVNRILL